MKNLDIVPYLQTFQESPIMTFQENPIFSLAKNKVINFYFSKFYEINMRGKLKIDKKIKNLKNNSRLRSSIPSTGVVNLG